MDNNNDEEINEGTGDMTRFLVKLDKFKIISEKLCARIKDFILGYFRLFNVSVVIDRNTIYIGVLKFELKAVHSLGGVFKELVKLSNGKTPLYEVAGLGEYKENELKDIMDKYQEIKYNKISLHMKAMIVTKMVIGHNKEYFVNESYSDIFKCVKICICNYSYNYCLHDISELVKRHLIIIKSYDKIQNFNALWKIYAKNKNDLNDMLSVMGYEIPDVSHHILRLHLMSKYALEFMNELGKRFKNIPKDMLPFIGHFRYNTFKNSYNCQNITDGMSINNMEAYFKTFTCYFFSGWFIHDNKIDCNYDGLIYNMEVIKNDEVRLEDMLIYGFKSMRIDNSVNQLMHFHNSIIDEKEVIYYNLPYSEEMKEIFIDGSYPYIDNTFDINEDDFKKLLKVMKEDHDVSIRVDDTLDYKSLDKLINNKDIDIIMEEDINIISDRNIIIIFDDISNKLIKQLNGEFDRSKLLDENCNKFVERIDSKIFNNIKRTFNYFIEENKVRVLDNELTLRYNKIGCLMTNVLTDFIGENIKTFNTKDIVETGIKISKNNNLLKIWFSSFYSDRFKINNSERNFLFKNKYKLDDIYDENLEVIDKKNENEVEIIDKLKEYHDKLIKLIESHNINRQKLIREYGKSEKTHIDETARFQKGKKTTYLNEINNIFIDLKVNNDVDAFLKNNEKVSSLNKLISGNKSKYQINKVNILKVLIKSEFKIDKINKILLDDVVFKIITNKGRAFIYDYDGNQLIENNEIDTKKEKMIVEEGINEQVITNEEDDDKIDTNDKSGFFGFLNLNNIFSNDMSNTNKIKNKN